MTERVAKDETRTTIKAITNITKTEKKLNKDKDDKPTILPRDLLTKKLINISDNIELKIQNIELTKLSIKNILNISRFLNPKVIKSLISPFCSLAFIKVIIKLKINELIMLKIENP